MPLAADSSMKLSAVPASGAADALANRGRCRLRNGNGTAPGAHDRSCTCHNQHALGQGRDCSTDLRCTCIHHGAPAIGDPRLRMQQESIASGSAREWEG
eukprot:10615368-Alexandrium_andersonii.AAC.1